MTIEQRMEAWRNGELSNGEALTMLLQGQMTVLDMIAEITLAMTDAEVKIADERMAGLGVPAISQAKD